MDADPQESAAICWQVADDILGCDTHVLLKPADMSQVQKHASSPLEPSSEPLHEAMTPHAKASANPIRNLRMMTSDL